MSESSVFTAEEVETIRRAMRLLGNRPSIVAFNLAGAYVRGYRGECSDCPIAIYLRRATGIAVLVGSRGVFPACYDGEVADADSAPIGFPAAIASFVRLFDAGEYSYLLDPDAHEFI